VPSDAVELVIERCRLADGTGSPTVQADVAIAGGRIAAVGALEGVTADARLGADGLVLAPGFIDVHVHSDARLLEPNVQEASLLQGVTTHIVGQDGCGFAPKTARSFPFLEAYTAGINGRPVPFGAGDMADYLRRFEGTAAVNIASLVPNGCLRMEVVGNAGRAASAAEVEEMRALCRTALAEGAVGLSSGLDYVPSRHAGTDELVALSSVAAESALPYVTHVRYERGLLAALEEAFEIARRASVSLHVSHLRGDPEYGAGAAEILASVDAARASGIDLTYDVYPYTYGSSFLPYVLPAWTLEGEPEEILARLADPSVRDRIRADVGNARWSWTRLVLAGRPRGEHERLVGLDLARAAAVSEGDEVDLVCDVLVAERLEALLVWKPDESPTADADLRALLAHPAQMLGSDGIYGPGRIHPRGHGSFARFLGRLVRDERVLPLEQAVARVTSVPARRFRLAGRGLIRPGCVADVVIFDPEAFVDRATFDHGDVPAAGVRDVFVAGVAVVRDGRVTGATPGRGLHAGSAEPLQP
jgi:N-acyl-D-amino-acid deacylase